MLSGVRSSPPLKNNLQSYFDGSILCSYFVRSFYVDTTHHPSKPYTNHHLTCLTSSTMLEEVASLSANTAALTS